MKIQIYELLNDVTLVREIPLPIVRVALSVGSHHAAGKLVFMVREDGNLAVVKSNGSIEIMGSPLRVGPAKRAAS